MSSTMDTKCCSGCAHTLPVASFLKDTSAARASKMFSTCMRCRESQKRGRKRKASRPLGLAVPLNPLETSIPANRLNREAASTARIPTRTPLPPSAPPASPSLPQSLPRPARPSPPPGFLPVEQWQWIQDFNTKMGSIYMETCNRCKQQWFLMDLKHGVCHTCFLRDQGGQTPYLMSVDNNMDPGERLASLPALTQIEEMIIARSHMQMLVHRYRGHQYHYSGHCVSFIQDTVKTVNLLPTLPTELDILLLRPSEGVLRSDLRYRNQFRSDFRVRRGPIMQWLYFLQANHPDYRWVQISTARIEALPVDADVSSS